MENDFVSEVKKIVKTHSDKLKIMKNNRSRSDEENWNDAEVRSCDEMIVNLASILGDLNREISKLSK